MLLDWAAFYNLFKSCLNYIKSLSLGTLYTMKKKKVNSRNTRFSVLIIWQWALLDIAWRKLWSNNNIYLEIIESLYFRVIIWPSKFSFTSYFYLLFSHTSRVSGIFVGGIFVGGIFGSRLVHQNNHAIKKIWSHIL